MGPEANGTLTLSGVREDALRYHMRPNRQEEALETTKLTSGWDSYFYQKAQGALSIDARTNEAAAVMWLDKPEYDGKAGTMKFKVSEASGSVSGAWEGKTLSEIPASFGAINLYVASEASASENPFSVTEGAVSVGFRGKYYYVNVDMTRGVSHLDIGKQYGKAVNRINKDAEWRISTFVSEAILMLATEHDVSGSELLKRIAQIKQNVPREYIEEIDGYASEMKSYFPLSASNLLYMYNLLPDAFRWTQCSALAAWGNSSSTGTNIVYRNLDWYEGLVDEMTELQAVIRYHYADRDVQVVGALGHLGCISGIVTGRPDGRDGIMGAIMDADVTGSKYTAEGRRSYNFDLRYSLENFNTKDEMAKYMSDKPYAFSNLIVLADRDSTTVLENNVSGMGPAPSRAVRTDTSELNPGIDWGYPSMVGAVNGFCLKGQVNNFSKDYTGEINVERWELMRKKIDELKGARPGGRLTPEDMKAIQDSYWGKAPGSLSADEGDLYNQQTQQMLLYVPAENKVDIFFKPLDGSTPLVPAYITIPLGQ